MHAHEIIRHTAHQAGIDPNMAIHHAEKALNEGMEHDKHGETIMFYKMLGNGSAHVHFVTADTPLNLVSSLQFFKHALIHHGVHTIYTNSESKRIATALGSIGVHFTNSNNHQYSKVAHI